MASSGMWDNMRTVWAGAIILALMAQAGLAQTLSSRNRSDLFSAQTKLLDTRAARQYSDSVRLQPPKEIGRASGRERGPGLV